MDGSRAEWEGRYAVPPPVQPWILNATVKANITFMEPWDERRYAAVLHACALTHDLEVRGWGGRSSQARSRKVIGA